MFLRPLLCVLLATFTFASKSQQVLVQTLKGTVIDRSLQSALPGATIELMGNSNKKTIADNTGNFRLEQVAVGRQSIRVTYVGYKTVTLNNLFLQSGKELELVVEMEEDIATTKEVTVTSKPNKSKALNEAAMVSSRMFSVEETRRFAAGINDPSRIATAFAGVNGNGDGNSLIIRGNAPNGLLWRMEGIDIPNPNHFASVGTSGGGISILSAQLLANSDFMTGAFPAEYGNALSGVFDIHLRKGNKDKREHTFAASTIGIDAATEGYFKKGYSGAYLINYRYGFLTLMQKFGLNIGDAATSFQDLSFNIHLPTKKLGSFSVFGFGGLSEEKTQAFNDSLTWTQDPSKRSGRLSVGNTGAIGITHSILLSKNTLLKTAVSLNGYHYKRENNNYPKFNAALLTTRDNRFSESDLIISTVATHKFSKHLLWKSGLYTTGKGFNLQQREAVSNVLKDKVKSSGDTRLTNYFTQLKWDPDNRFSFQVGLHGQSFALSKTSAVEPRFGMRIMTGKAQWLSFGFGLHSQVQPLGNYFARVKVGTDTVQPNRDIDFSRAQHYVLGYAVQLAPNWNLKAETYYQWLYKIPVTAGRATTYSLINQDDDYEIDALANVGKGKNYGVETTLERYWNDQFYLLGTLSLYRSKYLASDGIWRNSRFATNTASTFLMGKEWNLKTKTPSVLGVDVKILYNGGQRVTPIDTAKSRARKTTVLDNTKVYEEGLPSFFRIDLQAEWKLQYRERTGSLIFGVQNLLNRKNPVSQYFDVPSNNIRYKYLLGLIPVMGYKVHF